MNKFQMFKIKVRAWLSCVYELSPQIKTKEKQNPMASWWFSIGCYIAGVSLVIVKYYWTAALFLFIGSLSMLGFIMMEEHEVGVQEGWNKKRN